MLLTDYFIWHYSSALSGLWVIFSNYTKATWHRFLIGRHFITLFAPWHRRQPSDVNATGVVGTKILDAISNLYIRILAAFIRLSLIILGLISIVIVFITFILLFFIWIFWPILLVYSFIRGVGLIFG